MDEDEYTPEPGDECSCGGTILADGACDNDDHDDREEA